MRRPTWLASKKIGSRWLHWANKGFASGDYPNDPLERFPFIEAYAHTGDWQRALEQSRLAAGVAPVYEIVVCRLWERIAVEAPTGSQRDAGRADASGRKIAVMSPGRNLYPEPTLEGIP